MEIEEDDFSVFNAPPVPSSLETPAEVPRNFPVRRFVKGGESMNFNVFAVFPVCSSTVQFEITGDYCRQCDMEGWTEFEHSGPYTGAARVPAAITASASFHEDMGAFHSMGR